MSGRAKETEAAKLARKAKEKAAREAKQSADLAQFIGVLERAGNVVEREVPLRNPSTGREWRFDIFIVNCKLPDGYIDYVPIALEIDGIGFSHGSMKGIERDRAKRREAVIAGWRPIAVSWKEVGDGTALEILSRCGVNVESK